MQPNHQTWVWDASDGAVTNVDGAVLGAPIIALPEGLVESASNVDFVERAAMSPRGGFDNFATTGTGPSGQVNYLFNENNDTALWAFSSPASNTVAHRYASASWSAITLSDTVADDAQPHAVGYNGKVFLAYDSDVNRLHLWDGSAVRRVGVAASAAATVANTGAGAYAATLRYYKIQFGILSGSTIIAQSELSPSVSFTPSGAGAAARITKPTTPDSATHWRVYASTDDTVYYRLSAYVAVGTTTLDDTAGVSIGNWNEVAPVVGLYVPPPSAKYLATDGVRVIMAGAWESSAASGQTTPSARRVWFTRPLGATDDGDDESITHTADNRYWIDIDDPTGGPITGLSALGGIVYVFFARSIWRLIPTGQADVPFRAEQVATSAGALSQYAIAVGAMDTTVSDEAIYFLSDVAGLHRYSPSRGLEWLGRDVFWEVNLGGVSGRLAYDPFRRDLWVFGVTGASDEAVVIDVVRLQRRGLEYHGGARLFTTDVTNLSLTCGVAYDNFLVFSGLSSGGLYFSPFGTTDNGTAFTATVRSAALSVPGKLISAEAPTVLVYSRDLTSITLTARYVNIAEATDDSRSQTLTVTGAGSYALLRFDALAMSDAPVVQVELSYTASVSVETPYRIERVTVPYRVHEAA